MSALLRLLNRGWKILHDPRTGRQTACLCSPRGIRWCLTTLRWPGRILLRRHWEQSNED